MNNKKKRLLDFINKRLLDENLCEKYEIPLYDTVYERFCYVKYLILEIWNKEDIQKNLSGLFGLAYWKEIYLLLKEGI